VHRFVSLLLRGRLAGAGKWCFAGRGRNSSPGNGNQKPKSGKSCRTRTGGAQSAGLTALAGIEEEACRSPDYGVIWSNHMETLSDAQVITAAYQDTLSKLFGVLFEAYGAVGNDQGEITRAEERFSTALGLARKVRDRAIALAAGSA
jgi:hypothetical protein